MTAKTVPFDPTLFVNREQEQQLFLETVHAKSRHIYLEFNGVAGLGKSELLKWIYHNAEQEEYLSAYVDFEEGEYHRPEIYSLLETIANHLSGNVSPDSFAAFQNTLPLCRERLSQFYQDTLENPTSADPQPLREIEDTLIHAFNDALKRVLRTQKVVLCLDSTEKAYLTALRSFEESVLTKLIAEQNFLLVTAGQERLVWKSHEIKSLVKRYDLPRMEQDAICEQLSRLARKNAFALSDSTQISDDIFKLTLGHPFSNYKLIDFWTNGFQLPLTREVVNNRLGVSIKELIATIIEDRILENLELGDEYPQAREILWYLAPLRRIEFGTVWYVLSTFLKEEFQGKSFAFFEHLMERFQQKHIFMPWRLGIGYDLDPVVRNILLWDMRVNAERKQYIEIEKQLAEQYAEWVAQSRDATQIKNIVEHLYHYALYCIEMQPETMPDSIRQRLETFLESYFTLDALGNEVALRDHLIRLYRDIESDKEIGQLLQDHVPDLLHCIQEHMG